MLSWPMRGSRAEVTIPEIAAAKVTAGIFELRMVEDIEELDAKLESHGFSNLVLFKTAKSVFRMPGPWKDRRFAVPKRPRSCDANASGRK